MFNKTTHFHFPPINKPAPKVEHPPFNESQTTQMGVEIRLDHETPPEVARAQLKAAEAQVQAWDREREHTFQVDIAMICEDFARRGLTHSRMARVLEAAAITMKKVGK